MIVFYIELRSGGAAHKALHSVGLSSVDAAQSLSGIFTAYGCFVFCCFYVFCFYVYGIIIVIIIIVIVQHI